MGFQISLDQFIQLSLVKSRSRVQLFATLWTVVYQALPSMRFSRQEYWSWLPFPSPGNLPNPGTEPGSPAWQADSKVWATSGSLSHLSLSIHASIHPFTRQVLHISDGKESACTAGDPGSVPGLGRYPGERNGYPLQYSCLEDPMDREAWWATVVGSQRVGHDWATSLSHFHVSIVFLS